MCYSLVCVCVPDAHIIQTNYEWLTGEKEVHFEFKIQYENESSVNLMRNRQPKTPKPDRRETRTKVLLSLFFINIIISFYLIYDMVPD